MAVHEAWAHTAADACKMEVIKPKLFFQDLQSLGEALLCIIPAALVNVGHATLEKRTPSPRVVSGAHRQVMSCLHIEAESSHC